MLLALGRSAARNRENRPYQRHRRRIKGVHGEAKTWHGLARAVRRGLQNMRIQAFLTAAAVNLKRLAAALATPFGAWLASVLLTRLGDLLTSHRPGRLGNATADLLPPADAVSWPFSTAPRDSAAMWP